MICGSADLWNSREYDDDRIRIFNGARRAIVLAAGKGTRLQSDRLDAPKVLREAAGRPLLGWVLERIGWRCRHHHCDRMARASRFRRPPDWITPMPGSGRAAGTACRADGDAGHCGL